MVSPCTFPYLWTRTDILMDTGNFISGLTECTGDKHYKCITRWKISFETLTHFSHSRAAPSQLKTYWTLMSDVWFNKIRANFKAISNLEEVLPASLFVHLKVLKCFVDVNLFLFHHVLKISFDIICSAIWTRCQGLIGDITTTMLWQKIQKWKSWKYFCDFFARTEMSLTRSARFC